MSKLAAILASTLVACGLAAAAFYALAPTRNPNCKGSVVAGGKASIGGPFTLVNHLGETVTDADIITGPTLVYFGYTYCPDVCPLDTARNAEVVDILVRDGVDVQPVFISIDPGRDKPEVLADFVEVIHPRLIGLTGTTQQVDAASKAYRTYYAKNGEGEDYLMDHTTFTYLMGADGMWEFYRRDVTAADMAESVACHVISRS